MTSRRADRAAPLAVRAGVVILAIAAGPASGAPEGLPTTVEPGAVFAPRSSPPTGPPAGPPPFRKLRYEESYAYLREPGAPRSPVDPLKEIAIPWPATWPEGTVSFGGEVRWRYDYRHDGVWGEARQDDWGAFLQRYLLQADLRVGSSVRLFGQLRSALENGRSGEPSPVEKGPLDVQQAFVDLVWSRDGPIAPPWAGSVTVRGGRQEVALGSERLVSVREGTTIRRRFDGLRAIAEGPGFQVSALALYLTENEEGEFEDGTDTDESLWGVYAVLDSPLGLPTNLDLYYLGARFREATYEAGTARERRHSIGMRIHGTGRGFDWNTEAVFQWGDFGSDAIRAWTLASDTGYTFADWPWSPRLGLGANIASGDSDPDDSTLETFDPLYPRGNYFSHLALLGPRNFMNLHPGLAVHPARGVVLAVDANFYWRFEGKDAVYAPNGDILRRGDTTGARFVGPAISGSAEWQANRLLFLGVVYTHGFAGPFVAGSGPAKDIDFVEVTLRLEF